MNVDANSCEVTICVATGLSKFFFMLSTASLTLVCSADRDYFSAQLICLICDRLPAVMSRSQFAGFSSSHLGAPRSSKYFLSMAESGPMSPKYMLRPLSSNKSLSNI